MSANFISQLPSKAKLWAAHALAGIIIADGVVSESELEILRDSISFLDHLDDVNQIVNMVKNRQVPNLEVLRCDRKLACNLLMSLAMVALSDGNLSGYETKYFVTVAGKLGFEPRYSHAVMEWGREYIKLNNRKKGLIELGLKLQPVYVNF